MANFIMGVISLTIGVVVLANVFIYTVKNTNQTYTCINTSGSGDTAYNNVPCGWTTGEIALWGLLTICGIAGILYGILSVFGIA